MASLQRHVVKGHTYWRIVESRRVDGKPRPVPILYLGTADSLLERLLETPAGHLSIRSFQHGDVAALKAAADRLGIVSIIDRHFPGQRGRRPSVGTTLLLGALNRAVRPRSKRGWAAWAATTSLHRLFPGLEVKSLTSQFFWDQMDRIPLDVLQAIESELTRTVVQELDLDLDTLFYDTTNFFTYIASTNTKPKLAQRGRSKQKRSDLRLFGLALLVSREGQIPLCSHVYEGNQADSRLFPDSLSRIRQRLAELSVDLEQLTVVYDKGNLSKANQALVDEAPFGYVASLTPAHHRDLMAIGLDRYRPLPEGSRLEGVAVHRLRHEVWGAERTVVLFVSERLRAGQIRGLRQHLEKRLEALAQWKEQLAKPRSGPRSAQSAHRRIDELLCGQHLSEVLHIEYDPNRRGRDRLEYWVDDAALLHLETEVFGKRIVATNRDEWSTEDILLAYRGQSQVEAVFRQLKDDEHLALRPQYHWTDQKIHVHAFICLLALLLARIVEHQARGLGRREGLSSLLELLGSIRLAMTLHPSGNKGGRPRADWQLEVADPELADLFRALVPNKPPFVYTDGST
ncbi:MAG: IS1634 family transposase [Longimicrobiales bacterium]